MIVSWVAARSSSGRPSGTISNSPPRALSSSERTTCPLRPVTTIRTGSALRGLQEAQPLACVALAKRPPPPVVIEIPSDGFLDARVEIFKGPPAELGFELGRVDCIADVMPRAVGDELDQLTARAVRWRQLVENGANAPDNIDIAPFVAAADVVGLSNAPPFGNEIERPGMVFHVKPVADVLALS